MTIPRRDVLRGAGGLPGAYVLTSAGRVLRAVMRTTAAMLAGRHRQRPSIHDPATRDFRMLMS
jgi:hypothetical protein